MEAISSILLGLAVVSGVVAFILVAVVVFGLGWGIRRAVYAIKGEEYKPLLGKGADGEYEHQDVDAGATAESITRVLRRYTHAVVVGQRAKAGITSLENEKRKNAAFHAVLQKKFQPNSLSWDKFAAAADMTHDAVLRNCAALANRVQVFDRAGYKQDELGHRSSTWRKDELLDPVSAEKQRVLQQGLDEMDAILQSNDRLLTELDKLTFELDKLIDVDSNTDSENIVNEIRTLIDETKYYSQ